MADIKIKLNGSFVWVDKEDYVRLKTLDLQDFGYRVTEKEVAEQIDEILNNSLQNLSVIGKFIQSDFCTDE